MSKDKRYWLMKSEPDAFSWDDLVAEKETVWDGVRNHRASNNMRAMQVGEEAFFYHSNIGKEIVGVVRISKAGITDPTDPEGKWATVKVKPVRKLKRPVTLKEIKADPKLEGIELVRLGRLS
ncbi:MAG: EVE domain-containing protein, partial [Rhodocyclaceae bacterium]|nr:EVE domain-containing protein [Rhodocyclaceae bacterium]